MSCMTAISMLPHQVASAGLSEDKKEPPRREASLVTQPSARGWRRSF